MSSTIQQQVEKTYFRLRLAAAVIGFAFPLVLWIGGHVAGFGLRDSMSAYYHANPQSLVKCETPCSLLMPEQLAAMPPAGTMRNAFVGLLFAIGIILFVNKGHSKPEDILLTCAGVFAWCIAIFPMPWKCEPRHPLSMHGASALAFFLCIAIVSVFCSEDTVKYLPQDEQKRFRTCYHVLAGAMFGPPVLTFVINQFIQRFANYVFWIEFIGIYAFGCYWLVKTKEISLLIQKRATQGHIGTHAAYLVGSSSLQIPPDLFL